jgi:hypothetical protein
VIRHRIEVPEAAHPLDPLRAVGMEAEFLAQVASMHVDAAVKGGKIPTEHVPDPHLARHHPSGRPQEYLQQLEFDRREVQTLAAAAHYPRSVVYLKIAE